MTSSVRRDGMAKEVSAAGGTDGEVRSAANCNLKSDNSTGKKIGNFLNNCILEKNCWVQLLVYPSK